MSLPLALQTFFDAPESVAVQAAGYFHTTELKKGYHWLQQGEAVRKMAFIEAGYLRVYITQPDGAEVTQWVSSPGYFITDVAGFFDGGHGSRWHMQALTPLHLQEVGSDSYQRLHQTLPGWPALERRFLVKCFQMMEERILRHLHLSAEDRYRQLLALQPELVQVVPQQFLASMLGMSPETLSRIRARRLAD